LNVFSIVGSLKNISNAFQKHFKSIYTHVKTLGTASYLLSYFLPGHAVAPCTFEPSDHCMSSVTRARGTQSIRDKSNAADNCSDVAKSFER